MADGRNHVPCCIQERVPDICQDVCKGEYTPITDNIKTHFSCSSYTEQTLACIVEGIGTLFFCVPNYIYQLLFFVSTEILPSTPEDVEVEALTEKSLRISWSPSASNVDSVTAYSINITSLKTFDEHLLDPMEIDKNKQTTTSHIVQINVPANQNETTVNNLAPFTMYEVTVSALNAHGSSLPSYSIRSLTLTPGKMKTTTVGEAPKLPDIKSCCANKGIAHKTCVSKLCDPSLADTAEITDLMICAPWAADTFSCLTNGLDHTPCCKARGLPELCQQLCTGNVSSIDFNYFM